MLELLIFFSVVYFAIFIIVSNLHKKVKETIIENANNQNVIVCRTEIIGDRIYVWNKATDDFIVYGSSIAEIVEYFKKYYPGKRIVLLENKDDQENGIQSNGQ